MNRNQETSVDLVGPAVDLDVVCCIGVIWRAPFEFASFHPPDDQKSQLQGENGEKEECDQRRPFLCEIFVVDVERQETRDQRWEEKDFHTSFALGPTALEKNQFLVLSRARERA